VAGPNGLCGYPTIVERDLKDTGTGDLKVGEGDVNLSMLVHLEIAPQYRTSNLSDFCNTNQERLSEEEPFNFVTPG
jgi:hypothetical protein